MMIRKDTFLDQPYYSCSESSPVRLALFIRGDAMTRTAGDILKMRDAVSCVFPGGGKLIAPSQVHGTTILEQDASSYLPSRPQADGVFLNGCGAEGSLRFADCVPVVVWSLAPNPWILLLHSGFRGTTKNIVATGLDFVSRKYGRRCLRSSSAWIGPHIGACCYSRNLDDPATRAGLDALPQETFSVSASSAAFALGKAVFLQLVHSGVSESNILLHSGCTCCEKEAYYSYRGGDIQGRMFLLARIE